jgi:hypothetical protein
MRRKPNSPRRGVKGPRLSEKEIEIEKVRQFNFSRRGFSQMF